MNQTKTCYKVHFDEKAQMWELYSPLQRFRESTISPVTHINDKITIYNHTDDVQIRAESKVKGKLAFNNLKNMYLKNKGQN